MKDGFIRVAAAGIKIKVADPAHNAEVIIQKMEECAQNGAKVIVFPELALSGYTCGDLFLQEKLLRECWDALFKVAEASKAVDAISFVGLPFAYQGTLYNVAAAVFGGKILGIVPKTSLPNHNEFSELRYFTKGMKNVIYVPVGESSVPFGTPLLFTTKEGLVIGCEICEDLWAAVTPGTYHALNGANLLVNLSASNESAGKREYRKMLVTSASAKLLCGYVYSSAGEGESTQDVVFGGHHLIAENGRILKEAQSFANETIYGEIDIYRILSERRRNTSFSMEDGGQYCHVPFALRIENTKLERTFSKMPFVPEDAKKRAQRCEEIFTIQANGLKKRLEHTKCKNVVVGVSGGLDSTLALLVTVRAFDLLGLERSNIIAVTMPCFGTTDRTYENACMLAKTLGCTLREVDIKKAVIQHFEDIGQSMDNHDVTYENAQARERTQVLMDIANQCGGMVIGTGDLSELVLGWATYNGDHMSMYGVNGGIPKTLVRHLVRYYAEYCCETESTLKDAGVRNDAGINSGEISSDLKSALEDVLDTPVSPELLPPVDGVIAQKTEDLVGPYELHDFFLYYMLRFGFSPSKIYRIARLTFAEEYDEETILKWLKTFYRRFFAQQFKRSCLPDGPKVGSVSVSPRGDLQMPSDASASIWLAELESL